MDGANRVREDPHIGLNRTSVGLKRSYRLQCGSARGGLNRTSVGLKRRHLNRPGAEGAGRPQSNQRGIETGKIRADYVYAIHASIEPAWD